MCHELLLMFHGTQFYFNHILHQHTQELVEVVIASHHASTSSWIPKFSKQHEPSPSPIDNHVGNYHKRIKKFKTLIYPQLT